MRRSTATGGISRSPRPHESSSACAARGGETPRTSNCSSPAGGKPRPALSDNAGWTAVRHRRTGRRELDPVSRRCAAQIRGGLRTEFRELFPAGVALDTETLDGAEGGGRSTTRCWPGPCPPLRLASRTGLQFRAPRQSLITRSSAAGRSNAVRQPRRRGVSRDQAVARHRATVADREPPCLTSHRLISSRSWPTRGPTKTAF